MHLYLFEQKKGAQLDKAILNSSDTEYLLYWLHDKRTLCNIWLFLHELTEYACKVTDK